MSLRRLVVVVAGLVLLAGCSTLVPERAPPGPESAPLAQRGKALSTPDLIAYHAYWCARSAADRHARRALLAEGRDAIELMLLDYCDLADAGLGGTPAQADGERLAARDPPPAAAELAAWQQAWCARDAAARRERRAGLAQPADALELLLLDYCDEARRAPRALAQRLQALAKERPWPPGYAAWFEWLEWHLRAFAAGSAEATAQQQRMQSTIDQLRAIERDMSTRDPGAGTTP